MRGRTLLSLLCVLLASLFLTSPAYADKGNGNVPDLPPQAKVPELPKTPDVAKSSEAKVDKSSSSGSGAGSSAAATTAPALASTKTAVAATAIYVMQGRVVQIVAPSASAVGSVSFRVTASSRLATRLRGMMITFALTEPTALRPGARVTVRLRAPVNAMVFGFDSATDLRVAASG
jgi:hypothetical protein